MKKKMLCLILSFVFLMSSLLVGAVTSADYKKIRGDVNSDDVVNIKDVLILRKRLISSSVAVNETQADCNGDGEINGRDVLALRKYLSGLGTLYEDTVAEENLGWNTLYDWENEAVGVTPASTGITAVGAYVNTKRLSTYGVENKLLPTSEIALSIASITKLCNPTIGSEGTRISLDMARIANATNLRVCLNIMDKRSSQVNVVYIGFRIRSAYYYRRIIIDNYTDFGYFYYEGKEFSREIAGNKRTYLDDDPATLTVTKDVIPTIKELVFWYETSSVGENPLIVDNIDYFVGENGYDSSADDNALPQPKEPVNDGNDKYLAITFDDGPQIYYADNARPHYLEYYLDFAEEKGLQCSYFVIGSNCDSGDVSYLQRALELGWEIQNHTWDHTYLTEMQADEMKLQLSSVDDWLNANLGIETTMLRPPMLAMNSQVYSTLDVTCIGGYCPEDYNGTSVDYRIEYYKMVLKDGAIALVHEPYIDNVETVKRLYDYYSALGYKFVTLTEMFKIKGVTPEHNKMYNVIG